jgi:hypothetical protein
MRQMNASNVLGIIRLLERNAVSVWLDGGWGVDALVGTHTRPHKDVDLIVSISDVPKLQRALARSSRSSGGLRPTHSCSPTLGPRGGRSRRRLRGRGDRWRRRQVPITDGPGALLRQRLRTDREDFHDMAFAGAIRRRFGRGCGPTLKRPTERARHDLPLPDRIETERLTLRGPGAADASVLFDALTQDPPSRGINNLAPARIDSETEAFVAECIARGRKVPGYCILDLRAQGTAIGILEARTGTWWTSVTSWLARSGDGD